MYITLSKSVCLLVIHTALLLLLSSCSVNQTTYKRSSSAAETGAQTETSKKYSKPTQRPYVIGNKRYYPIPSAEGYREQGRASWYGKKFHGRKTANGETYDMYGDTAAHKTLPMGTMLLVTNLENGKEIVVRVNDRGPFVKNRIIDLTYTAAKKLGMIKNGTAKVEIVAISPKKQPEKTAATLQREPAVNTFDQGNFYVQVGAFEHLENARQLAKKFAATGRDVTIQQYPAAGIQLYRVMVYGGTSLKKVKVYEHYLEQNGYPNALIIAR